jgi:hypothetical protein
MKKLIIFLFSVSLFAQDYGNDAEALELCTTLQSNSFSSDLDADNALDRILSVVGLSKNFVLSPCSDINNAVAVSYKGVRYILYDTEFMSMLSSNTSNWTNLFILAHEVGHHVNGHSLDLVLYAGDIVNAPELEKKRQQELEADEFAGFVLAKLGASLSQTTSSVSKLSNEDDTYSTHPKRDKRVNAIRKGFFKNNSVYASTSIKNRTKNKRELQLKSYMAQFFYNLKPKVFNTNTDDFDEIVLNGKLFISDYFLIGDENQNIFIEFGVVSDGGGLLKVNSETKSSEVYVNGDLIFVLINGKTIVCKDRKSKERIKGDIYSYYYLTKQEIDILKQTEVSYVEFKISNDSETYILVLENDDINKKNIAKLFK